MATKKLLDEHNPENTVVHVVFRGSDNKEYECIGVLMREGEGTIRVAFSAKDDKVVDFLDIKRSDIISIDIMDPSKIGLLGEN